MNAETSRRDPAGLGVVIATSEAVPYSKTGGLADVTTALAKALDAAGHRVSLFVPHHRVARIGSGGKCPPVHDADLSFEIPVGTGTHTVRVLRSELPGTAVQVFLIDQPDLFHRRELYSQDGQDYPDNCERFVFFSRAVIEAVRRLALRPDIMHCNDWQTGLIPALLDVEYRDTEDFENCASLYTIHNLAYQGQFWHWDMQLTGLDWKYFNWRQMESFGNLNLMKTGIAFADRITTVSPTYAREIQTSEFGCGLNAILEYRKDNLVGILNGIDPEVWNPETDSHIAANYSADCFRTGKPQCRAALRARLGLPDKPDTPVCGMISRLAAQKGLDLIQECADQMLREDIQYVFLGTGESQYHDLLNDLRDRAPDKVSVTISFEESLAHQIEAGSDLFLMPSHYEPCGLNQMYSMAYGTVPIVRHTGGLADSVVDANPLTIASGTATGFVFREASGDELVAALRRARHAYRDRDGWEHLVRQGMRQDLSWRRRAERYAEVYRSAIEDVKGRAARNGRASS